MADAIVGQTITESFALVDANDGNAPITGATFAVIASSDPAGAPFAVAFTELGGGQYTITVGPFTAAGLWSVTWESNDATNQGFTGTWQVGPALTYLTPFGGLTRQALRRAVLDLIGDHVVLSATQASGSSQWVDEDNLAGQAGRYAGRQLYVTGGTPQNVGQTRQVSGSNRQYTLQLARSLPAPVQPGDEAELVNTWGVGLTVERVHRTLDQCLADADLHVPVAYQPERLTAGQYAIPLPDEFYAVERVQFRTADDRPWENLKRAKVSGDAGWQVDHAGRAIRLAGHVADTGAGLTLNILGRGKPAPLTNETDVAPVDGEWLMYEAASRLLLRTIGVSRTGESSFERKGFYFQQKADRLRDSAADRIGPSYTVV